MWYCLPYLHWSKCDLKIMVANSKINSGLCTLCVASYVCYLLELMGGRGGFFCFIQVPGLWEGLPRVAPGQISCQHYSPNLACFTCVNAVWLCSNKSLILFLFNNLFFSFYKRKSIGMRNSTPMSLKQEWYFTDNFDKWLWFITKM